MTVARVVLFLALAAAVGFALVMPLLHLNRRSAAGRAETSFPEFQERLLTYVERSEQRDPMLDLLAMDTMSVASKTEPERVAPRKSIFALRHAAGAAGAVLLWLILAGPGFLGYGASLLWAGTAQRDHGAKFYDIIVSARQQTDPPQSRSGGHRAADRLRGPAGAPVRAISSTAEVGRSAPWSRATAPPTSFCSPRCRSRWNITSKRPA